MDELPTEGGQTLPSEPEAGKQIDKLDAIKYAKDNDLIDEQQGKNAAEGMLGGRKSPASNPTPQPKARLCLTFRVMSSPQFNVR